MANYLKGNEVEIIDLKSSASSSSYLNGFPVTGMSGAIGGLDFNDDPLICGGGDEPKCFTWRNSSWQISSPLNQKRYFPSTYTSPFPKESHKLMVAGGEDKLFGKFLFLYDYKFF